MVIAIRQRASTSERWQAALQRAHAEGVQVRQLAGCGMWIATSSSDTSAAYEVSPWSCECQAGQSGDPVCKHRAILLEKLERLILDPEPEPTMCAACNGQGHTSSTELFRGRRVSISLSCHQCHGTGYDQVAV